MARILNKKTLQCVAELVGDGPERNLIGPVLLSLTKIDLENHQFEYRLDPDNELLVDSIRKVGQQIPVFLRGARPPYQLVCGFQRVRSLRKLGKDQVNVLILKNITDEQAHRLSVLENEERKNLTDLDRGNACKRLYDEGKTQEQIAEVMGCSRPKVSRYLTLLKLPPLIFEALKKNRIPTTLAIALNKSYKDLTRPQVTALIEQIADKELSFRELQKKLSRLKKGRTVQTEKPIYTRTRKGFKVKEFTYKRSMDETEKQAIFNHLKRALDQIAKELGGEKEGTDE